MRRLIWLIILLLAEAQTVNARDTWLDGLMAGEVESRIGRIHANSAIAKAGGRMEDTRQLWEDFGRRENRRVPMTFVCDEQMWLKATGHKFGEFYNNPQIHLKVQLEGRRWFCDNIAGDMIPGYPERWDIGVKEWMDENEFFGCEVIYQEDDYAWAQPLPLEKESLLAHIADLDPEERVRTNSAFKMYQALKDLSEGMVYLDRPVDVIPPGGGTHGIFTKAAEIRGLEQICIDLHEDPELVEKLLRLVTDKTIARIKAFRKLTGIEAELPSKGGWGFADDSLQMLSGEMYENFVLPSHERLYSAMTTGARSIHLCGRSSQHYELLAHELGVTALDGPGPFIDHGHYLRTLGPDFSFSAQTDHTVLARGPESEIDAMMRKLLSPEAKLPGRFSICGFVHRDTDLRNVGVCYAAAQEYGQITKLA